MLLLCTAQRGKFVFSMLISCHRHQTWLHFLLACSKKTTAPVTCRGTYSHRRPVGKKQEKDLKILASAFCCHSPPVPWTRFVSSGSFSHTITQGSRQNFSKQEREKSWLISFIFRPVLMARAEPRGRRAITLQIAADFVFMK